MHVLLELFFVLLIARLFGELFHRFRQPGSIGEILAGVAVALATLAFGDAIPFLKSLSESEVVSVSAETGIFALILLAGVEIRPRRLLHRSARSILVALFGAALPLFLGIALAWTFLPQGPFLPQHCLLVGVALAITAIPASVRVMEDMGVLQTEVAQTILAAAIIDDIIGLFLLAVLLAFIQTGAPPDVLDIAVLVLKVLAFFAISTLFGHHIYPHLRRGVELMQALAVEITVLVLGSLAYAVLAELLGLHWILGPFMAGLFFEPQRVGEKVYEDLRLAIAAITNGILGPIFFFSIGLRLDPSAVIAVPGFLALLIAAAFFGKLAGAGLPARLMGMNNREALAVGVGMSSRGAVELVILSLAAGTGILASRGDHPVADNLFSALVITAVVTTLLAPILLRWLMPVGAKPPSGRRKPKRSHAPRANRHSKQ